MGFLLKALGVGLAVAGVKKIKHKKGKEDAIINTDMICRIAKTKSGYIVFFSSGNTGAAYYEYDEAEAKKIFDAIGVALD